MKEIIGVKLLPVFRHYTAESHDYYARRTYRIANLEVWEVNQKLYDVMMSMPAEEFYSFCEDRAGYGHDGFNSTDKYDYPVVVRGRKMLAKHPEHSEKECVYPDLMYYLTSVLTVVTVAGASNELKELAKANRMSISELLRKYQDPLDLDDAVEIAEALSSLYPLMDTESSAVQKICEFVKNC